MRPAVVLVALVTTLSCSDGTLTSPTSAADLEGTWRLFQMTTGAGVHNEDLNAGRFNITLSASTLQARADCNSCGGSASLSGSTLTVGPLACTLAACATAPLDTRFTGLLTGPLTVRLNNRVLQLNNAQGGELRFQK